MKEDLIYGLLMLHMPSFGSNRIPILEEHRHLAEQTTRFERTLLQANIDDSTARKMLCDEGRAFVAHERAHMKAEEELILPSAERWLKAEHWAEVDVYAMSAKNLEHEKPLNDFLGRLLETIKAQQATDQKQD
jgi:hemerythrin-like domain-containing protein